MRDLGAEHNIFGRRQGIDQRIFLVDHAESLADRVGRIANGDWLAVNENFALVRGDQAVQNIH